MADLRYAVRRLLASPGFACAALATMALGIGANAAIFTVVNTVMLKPAAVERPDRLVEVYTSDSNGVTPATSSYLDYLDLQDLPVFTNAAAYQLSLLNRSDNGISRVVFAESVAGNYFTALGIRPILGRAFTSADDRPGGDGTTILGHAYWQRQFGGDRGIVGRTLTLNGRPVTVIGVAPPAYKGGFVGIVVDLWIPMNLDYDLNPESGARDREERGNRSLFMKARLADGVSLQQAQAAVDVLAIRLGASFPTTNKDRKISLYASSDVRLHPNIDKAIAPVAALLMAVPGLVLLVACANVANLLLARSSGRAREIAVRLAVGASRGRLVRLLLTESVTLSTAGGLLGLLTAGWLTRLIQGWTPPGLPIPLALDLGMDQRVMWFTLLVSIATGVVFGLAPALQVTRPALLPALRDDASGWLRAHRRFGLRNVLVVTQVAVSLVLLTAAGLFVRSLQRAQEIDPGFERERALILTPATMLSGLKADERRVFTETLRDRLAILPGVETVALADRVPLGAQIRSTAIVVDDQQPDANGMGTPVDYTINDVGYFRALGIPVLRGRDFTMSDDKTTPNVAIVSEAFAARFWPDVDPIGRQIRFATGRRTDPKGDAATTVIAPMTVVGVARDTKVRTLGEDPRPYFYRPWRQTDEDMAFVIRTAGNPVPLVNQVRQTVTDLNPDLPILSLNTMQEHLSLMLTPPRLAAAMLGLFGSLAVLLASLGLYGVVAYSTARRTREIGVRVALGADHRQVVWLVVREGMLLVGVGLAIGFVLTAAATRPLAAYLYGLGAFDPLTFISVSAILAGTALVANYLPARRATKVDPMIALRSE
jgi:predicted permease